MRNTYRVPTNNDAGAYVCGMKGNIFYCAVSDAYLTYGEGRDCPGRVPCSRSHEEK